MSKMAQHDLERRSVPLDDVMMAATMLDEGVYVVTGDPRSDEDMQASLEEFERMLQEAEPQHLLAYGPTVVPRMPRVAHGDVIYPKPSNLPF